MIKKRLDKFGDGDFTGQLFILFEIILIVLIGLIMWKTVNSIAADNAFNNKYTAENLGSTLNFLHSSPGNIYLMFPVFRDGATVEYVQKDYSSIKITAKNLATHNRYIFQDSNIKLQIDKSKLDDYIEIKKSPDLISLSYDNSEFYDKLQCSFKFEIESINLDSKYSDLNFKSNSFDVKFVDVFIESDYDNKNIFIKLTPWNYTSKFKVISHFDNCNFINILKSKYAFSKIESEKSDIHYVEIYYPKELDDNVIITYLIEDLNNG